jgi:hypothetical protein
MSISLGAFCDGTHNLGGNFVNGDTVYCGQCYHELEVAIEDLEREIGQLRHLLELAASTLIEKSSE